MSLAVTMFKYCSILREFKGMHDRKRNVHGGMGVHIDGSVNTPSDRFL